MQDRAKLPRTFMLMLALAFLFETWIWDSLVAAARGLIALVPWTELKARIALLINKLPAPAALLLFGVPFVLVEVGSLGCVFLIAIGHVFSGVILYVALKIVGLGLVAVIFDLTRDKLLSMRWFAMVYDKFVAFHDFAQQLVTPYKIVAAGYVAGLRLRALAYRERLRIRRGGEIG